MISKTRADDPVQVHCIYHGGCPDGFTAAWVVWRAHLRSDDVCFYPSGYGTPPPELPENARVYIVDFSYPRDVLLELASKVASVTVFDHHASAERDLADVEADNLRIEFDMERSGAGITWDELSMSASRPPLVDYVEDRDLWRFKMPWTHDVSPLFMGIPMGDFKVWDQLDLDMRFDLPGVIARGAAMRMMREKIIDDVVATARTMMIDGYIVPAVSSPYALGSDVAGVLAAGHPFAVYYVDKPEGRQFGLRSTDDGLDVSLVAGRYGGGGHAHAAGFKVPWGHELAPAEAVAA